MKNKGFIIEIGTSGLIKLYFGKDGNSTSMVYNALTFPTYQMAVNFAVQNIRKLYWNSVKIRKLEWLMQPK